MRTNVVILLLLAVFLFATSGHADTMERLRDASIAVVDTDKRTVSVTLTPKSSERGDRPYTTPPMEITDDSKLFFITGTNGRKKATVRDLKPGMHIQFSGIHGWRMNRIFELRVLPR